MGGPDKIKVVRVGSTAPSDLTPAPAPKQTAARRKTMKTYPRGVLKKTAKIRPIRNPTKAPPRRNGTLRILTEKGIEQRRRRIETTVRNLPDTKVKETLEKSGYKVKNPKIAREILKGGMEAGFLSPA
jgi:hypothetical protein